MKEGGRDRRQKGGREGVGRGKIAIFILIIIYVGGNWLAGQRSISSSHCCCH